LSPLKRHWKTLIQTKSLESHLVCKKRYRTFRKYSRT